jgi:YidC/Oxa1 family membrane protein insertase
MDTRRLVLFVIFAFSTMLLWDAWQSKHAPVNTQTTVATSSIQDIANAQNPAEEQFSLAKGQRITVTTDLFKVEIDSTGGDIRYVELLKHRADNEKSGNYVLMSDKDKSLLYVAQSGLKGKGLPTHHTVFSSAQTTYTLQQDSNELSVHLVAPTENGVTVEKIITFHRNQYAIGVKFEIINGGNVALTPSVYYQIIHDNQSNQGSALMPTFTGGAYYNEQDKYKKINFDEMAKKDLAIKSNDGWVGLVQHYFVGAWVPQTGLARKFYTSQLNAHDFSIGTISPLATVQPGQKISVTSTLFAGPQEQGALNATAKGLEYTVDYGWLTVIAKPLFWLLSKIHGFVNNWGVAIILLTVMIKAAFFKLSATGYRNMAQMREMAPRLQSMKEKFGDDKQKMQQAMLEMYRTEKINPLGGCLPILVQIPVFISLYWMLLGSVELRHAPFFGWIQDLSAKDPYYVLPILMGASMIIQTYLNPTPTDPIQAKVMKIMPVVFSVFFFFFPAGLVLYWLVNNILSIWQQWYVNKTIHAAALAKKGNASK